MENFEQKRKNAFYSKASNKMDMRKSFNPSLFHSSLTLKEKLNEDLKLNTNESEKEQNIINDENIYVNRNSLNNNIFKNNNDKKISLFEEMRNSLKPLIKTKTLNDRVKKNIKIRSQLDSDLVNREDDKESVINYKDYSIDLNEGKLTEMIPINSKGYDDE